MTRQFEFQSIRLTALFAVLVLVSQAAHAQVTKPFKINGQGYGPYGLSLPALGPFPATGPVPHFIEGNATHLGRHTGAGFEETLTADLSNPFLITGTFESNPGFKFFGANGDILSCTYGDPNNDPSSPQGTYTLTAVNQPGFGQYYVANFVAEFVPTAGCTGKFEGVTGKWVMYATSQPFRLGVREPFTYSWYGEGTLTFKKGK